MTQFCAMVQTQSRIMEVPRVRPAHARAKQIVVNDVVFVEGVRANFVLLAEEVCGDEVSGIRILNGKLVPTHVNLALVEARSVLVPDGGLMGLVLQYNIVERGTFDLSEISDEQETLVRIATMSEAEAAPRDNSRFRNEAIELIRDPVMRAELAIEHGLADRAEDIVRYVTDVNILKKIINEKIPSDRSYNRQDSRTLLDHFFNLDADAFAEWLDGEMGQSDGVLGYRLDHLPKHPKILEVMTNGSLRTKCLIVARIHDHTWEPKARIVYDHIVNDKDPWLGCFLFTCLDSCSDGIETLIMPLLNHADVGILRLKAGERPDVPWRDERYGTTNFVITDAWCDEWLAAIESWRKPQD